MIAYPITPQSEAAALIGFGTSAIGALPQGYVQNAASTVDYRAAIRAGRLAIVRGWALTDEDRMRREIIERLMCDLEVDVARVCDAHGFAPSSLDGSIRACAALQDDGLCEVEGHRIRIPAEASRLMRVVAAAFDAFLPETAKRHARAI